MAYRDDGNGLLIFDFKKCHIASCAKMNHQLAQKRVVAQGFAAGVGEKLDGLDGLLNRRQCLSGSVAVFIEQKCIQSL